MELSLLRTFAPGSESTMVWNFRSLELLFPGTFAPGSESSWNFRSQELSLPGTFAPESESAKNFRSHDICAWMCTHTRLRPSFNVCFTNALYAYLRQRPHNHHIQDTTLVSLTVILNPHALQRLLLTLSHYCLNYFSIRPTHTQTFHYFTSTVTFSVLHCVKLILLNEYYDDDAYYTEHRQRQWWSALSKHNGY